MFDLLKDCHYERKWSKSAPTTGDFKHQARMRLSYRCEPTSFLFLHSHKIKIRHSLRCKLHFCNFLATCSKKKQTPNFILLMLAEQWPPLLYSVWNLIFSDSTCPSHTSEGNRVSLLKQRGDCYTASGVAGSYLSVASSLFSLCSAGKMTVSASALFQFKLSWWAATHSREQQATSETRSRARFPPEHAWHQTQTTHSLNGSAETFCRRGRGICSSNSKEKKTLKNIFFRILWSIKN